MVVRMSGSLYRVNISVFPPCSVWLHHRKVKLLLMFDRLCMTSSLAKDFLQTCCTEQFIFFDPQKFQVGHFSKCTNIKVKTKHLLNIANKFKTNTEQTNSGLHLDNFV